MNDGWIDRLLPATLLQFTRVSSVMEGDKIPVTAPVIVLVRFAFVVISAIFAGT